MALSEKGIPFSSHYGQPTAQQVVVSHPPLSAVDDLGEGALADQVDDGGIDL